MKRATHWTVWTVVGASLILAACQEERVQGGEITIRNDILDKEYNVVVIDQITAGQALKPFRRALHPGESVSLPYKKISELRFSRRYAEFSRVYLVQCPEDVDKKILMKLIDVHLNRLSGGCALVRRGKQRSGSIEWEDN